MGAKYAVSYAWDFAFRRVYKVREGVRAAEAKLEELLERYSDMLEYIARGILREDEAVEDCLSRVWLRAVERFPAYDPARGAVSTWLSVLCRSTALDCLREHRRKGDLAAGTLGEELADSAPGPEEELLRRERAERLRAALGRLSEADRQLFYRKYYYLQSTAQLAAELGMTERAVEGRLYRIKKRLRAMLGGDEA